MNILAVDTAGKTAGVALLQDDRLLYEVYLDEGAIVAAEWSENFADLLALEHPIRVDIQRVDENTRRITIEGVTL